MPDAPESSRIPPSANPAERESAAEALRDSVRSAREAGSYVKLLIATTLDKWKLSALTLGVYVVLGVFAACAGIAVVVTAVVLLLVGGAHGIGVALGGREWLGDLIVGFVLLAALTIGVSSFLDRIMAGSRKRTVRKYAAKHNRQRQAFGRDASASSGQYYAN